jgi:Na+/H+ antiporter NhaA
MSIFVDTLSFGELAPEMMNHLRNLGKIAILAASLSAGVLGSVLISVFSKNK